MGKNKLDWPKIEKEVNKKEGEITRKKYEKIKKKKEEKNVEDILKEAVLGLPEEREEQPKPKEKEKKHFYKEIEELSQEAQALAMLRYKNLFKALRLGRSCEIEKNFYDFLLEDEMQEIKKKDKSAVPDVRAPRVEGLLKLKKETEKEQDELKKLSPESYVALHLKEFKKQIKQVQKGEIMETNYVKEMEEWAMDKIKDGYPIFLHGHLGAGKTDFALHIAQKRMKELLIYKEMKKWLKANGEAIKEQIKNKGKEAVLEEIKRQYFLIKKEYERKINDNDEEVMKEINPYFIVGSKDFSLKDLYIEKTLKPENIFNDRSLQEHSKNIENEFNKWREENKEKLDKFSPEEKKKKEQQMFEQITKLYMKKNEGYGVAVKQVKKEFLRAIEEGKPIIIDEASAVPPTLFIGMNDILTARPGESVYIPGIGKRIKIKEGFSIIMTGNINNSPLVNYIGAAEEFNPAFLSRLKVKEYEYLPQNTDGMMYEQEEPEKNELFQVLIAFLANKDGSLKLPKGSLEKIFSLAKLAKITQRVFSGKWRDEDAAVSGGDRMGEEPSLKEAVLSVRNLISVLNEWKKGLGKNLDKALWDGFISNITNPKDQSFIFYHARKLGFFLGQDWKGIGWDDLAKRESSLTWKDISEKSERDLSKEYEPPSCHYYSPREVVEFLYGKAPERTEFPENPLLNDSEDYVELKPEDVAEIREFMQDTGNFLKIVEEGLKKEGCL